MRFQHAARAAVAAALLLCGLPAAAQPVPEAASAAPASSGACCAVPARTPIVVDIVDAISTRTNRTGELFAIRLAEPLIVEGRVVAPAGTPGVGEIVHSARAGAMGRAGELILAARYLEIGETRVRLRSLRFGRQGRDSSSGAAIASSVAGAVMPLASMVGFLVQGGQVTVPAGTRADAMTAEATMLAPASETTATTTSGGE